MGYDMGRLYDNVDIDRLGGGRLYDNVSLEPSTPDSLLYRDLIVVQPMRHVETPYGGRDEPDGKPAWCRCCIEGRTQKNSVFSENWAQDTTPDTDGGLRAVTLDRVLAKEWHGDIHTRFWWDGCCWQVDGEPVYMRHGSDTATHWEFPARKIGTVEDSGLAMPMPEEGSRVWGT